MVKFLFKKFKNVVLSFIFITLFFGKLSCLKNPCSLIQCVSSYKRALVSAIIILTSKLVVINVRVCDIFCRGLNTPCTKCVLIPLVVTVNKPPRYIHKPHLCAHFTRTL